MTVSTFFGSEEELRDLLADSLRAIADACSDHEGERDFPIELTLTVPAHRTSEASHWFRSLADNVEVRLDV